jgi:hypothetical protein
LVKSKDIANFVNNISVATGLREVADANVICWKPYSGKSEGNKEW